MVSSTRARRLYDQVAKNRKKCLFEDLARLHKAVGFVARATGGSHVVFNRAGCKPLTVPRRKPVKEHYLNEALAIIDEAMP